MGLVLYTKIRMSAVPFGFLSLKKKKKKKKVNKFTTKMKEHKKSCQEKTFPLSLQPPGLL